MYVVEEEYSPNEGADFTGLVKDCLKKRISGVEQATRRMWEKQVERYGTQMNERVCERGGYLRLNQGNKLMSLKRCSSCWLL